MVALTDRKKAVLGQIKTRDCNLKFFFNFCNFCNSFMLNFVKASFISVFIMSFKLLLFLLSFFHFFQIFSISFTLILFPF